MHLSYRIIIIVATLRLRLLNSFLDKTSVREKAVRFRTCQLVAELLMNMNEDIEIRYCWLVSSRENSE